MRVVDIADLTVAERVDFLVISHDILMRDTTFLAFCYSKFEHELVQLWQVLIWLFLKAFEAF